MPNQPISSESTPQHLSAQIREMLTTVIERARGDAAKAGDPKAQALFETTAEVLIGLRKAYADFESRSETAWKRAS